MKLIMKSFYFTFSWHGSSALANNRILIHGGYDGNLALEDTHIFNLGNFFSTAQFTFVSLMMLVGHPISKIRYMYVFGCEVRNDRN